MCKVVRQSINGALRQPNPEVTAYHVWVLQNTRDFIQAALRDFRVNMHKPEHIAMGGTRPHVHLHRPIGSASNELITKAYAEISCVIGASAVGDNNLRVGCSVTQMLEKSAYKCRLIKGRNNY